MIETMVRGYRVYKEVWCAAVGEELSCMREMRTLLSSCKIGSNCQESTFRFYFADLICQSTATRKPRKLDPLKVSNLPSPNIKS